MKTGRWLAKRANDRLGDGERAREPGRFNPEQVYQTAQPVVLWGLDDEIRSGLARPAELGPNSGIIGHQRAIGEPGPIGPNPRIERVGAPRVESNARINSLSYPMMQLFARPQNPAILASILAR